MKITVLALGLGLVGASAVEATPYYVGKHLTPRNNVSLNFQDTPTKERSAQNLDTGNIAAFELNANYRPIENMPVGLELPFYTATKDATGTGESRSALGNIGLSFGWDDVLSASTDDYEWGYSVALDSHLPTSRKTEAAVVAAANPTTDLYSYADRTTTISPRAGLFIQNDMFMAKTNFGYGYHYASDKAFSGRIRTAGDNNLNTFTWQTAATWKAMPYLNANLEYNTLITDKQTARLINATREKRYLHAISPSVSGEYDQVAGNIYVNVPLDKATRDVQNVAFGLNVGYMF